MSRSPLRSLSMPLCAWLASSLFALASPVFAAEARGESAPSALDLAQESGSEVASDLSAVAGFERRVDRELRADVSRMLDSIVTDRTHRQMRWLEQHYFDAAAARGRISRGAAPLADRPPANQR